MEGGDGPETSPGASGGSGQATLSLIPSGSGAGWASA